MRAWAFILLLIGFYLAACAGYDEYRGITRRPLIFMPLTRDAILDNPHGSVRVIVLKKNNNPLFRRFMTTHWIWTGAFLVAAGGAYWMDRQKWFI